MEAGRVLGGRYRLDYLIGAGGMGQVWAARHLTLGSPTAIKLLGPTSDPALARRRFAREAKAAADLRSPHVVHVYDYDPDPVPYLAMELLEGRTLRERLAGGARLSLDEASWLMTQACRALELARERGIVHRDIKPSNLFVARYGKHEILKVLDFGVARVTSEGTDEEPVTSSGSVVGSLPYLSPEQADGRVVNFKSDQWSLAVVAFRMLTGAEPFAAANGSETLARICSGERRVASVVRPELPAELDAFFARALAVAPEERHATPAELAEELEQIAQRYGDGNARRASAHELIEPRTGPTQSFSRSRTHRAEIGLAGSAPRVRRAVAALVAVAVLSAAALAIQPGARREPAGTLPRPSQQPLVAPRQALTSLEPAQPHIENPTPSVRAQSAEPSPTTAARKRSRPPDEPRVDVDPIFGLHVMSAPRASHENSGTSRSVAVVAAPPAASGAARDSAGERDRRQ